MRGVGAVALAAVALAACVKSKAKDEHAGSGTAGSGAASSAGSGSGSAPAPGGPAPAIVIDSEASARAAIGKHVRIDGTGDNAKLGAVVVKNDLVVYCVDRKDGWDERNVPVVVEGVLDYTDAARAQVGSNGELSTGTGGPIFQMTCVLVKP